ncbi:MAG: hypothetical protein ACFB50_14580 [Rubrobacteraceae bacterium]
MYSLRTALMLSTAILTAGKDLALLVFYLAAHLASGRESGRYTEQAKRRARATRLWTILQATGTERKVMLFEYLLKGPVAQTFGAHEVMRGLFRAITEPDGPSGLFPAGTLNALLATRYDEELEASFYLEAALAPGDPYAQTLEYLTGYATFNSSDSSGLEEIFYAAWPDATQALMSYYGNGESEMAAVGFDEDLYNPNRDPERSDEEDAA